MSNFKKIGVKFDHKKLRQATNQLFTKVSWRHHVVKGLCLTQIPGDPTSAYGEKLRGIFWTKPDFTGQEVQRENFLDERQYTEFIEKYKGTYFEEIYNTLSKKYIIGRFRLLLLEPRTS